MPLLHTECPSRHLNLPIPSQSNRTFLAFFPTNSTGREIDLDIEPTDKVARIKERVEEKEGIPPAQQRLIFGGKQMHDEKGVSEFGLEGGSVLHVSSSLWRKREGEEKG